MGAFRQKGGTSKMYGMVLLQIIFWSSLFFILHSYLFYPLLLRWLGRAKSPHGLVFEKEEDWPHVSVLMALYNEEKVVAQKLESLLAQDYPKEKLRIFLGSDCSTDKTNSIIDRYCETFDHLHFFPFTDRQGKPGVINFLAREANIQEPESSDHVYLITDANVILTPSTISKLVRHFKDPRLAIVDAHMVHTGMQEEGISHSENQYISSEVRLKDLEGRVWGYMMGPFGGCYTIRSNYFTQVPPNFLVDDFFITMQAFERGGLAINDLEAVCHEAVSHDWREEYRRKSRISTGNFQNLFLFSHLWWPPFRPLSFAFFSHKVLRWLVPFFLILMGISILLLAWFGQLFYQYLLVAALAGVFLMPLLDIALIRLGANFLPLRHIRYFLLMNLALFVGFLRYLKGVKSSIWEPPKRN